jgi:kynurenine formamidase
MYIDLSHVVRDGLPVYPGDSETVLAQTRFLRRDEHNNHQLTINMHAGTHIDGPMHLLDGKEYLDEFPLTSFIGEGCLLDVSHETEIRYKEAYERLVRPHQIVILYTGHGQYFGQERYFADHPVLTVEFAEFLVRKQVKMVGLDTPSPDHYPFEVHKLLLQNRILIAENLTNVERLRNVKAFEIIALPLRIRADSAVARVIARVI